MSSHDKIELAFGPLATDSYVFSPAPLLPDEWLGSGPEFEPPLPPAWLLAEDEAAEVEKKKAKKEKKAAEEEKEKAEAALLEQQLAAMPQRLSVGERIKCRQAGAEAKRAVQAEGRKRRKAALENASSEEENEAAEPQKYTACFRISQWLWLTLFKAQAQAQAQEKEEEAVSLRSLYSSV
ncbi:hypothetical protein BFW01_g9743 [Lasiodiplodia theobromae]|nr:hypothetical protein BFW01_g9743 [Lasiodiplodia theobromae]